MTGKNNHNGRAGEAYRLSDTSALVLLWVGDGFFESAAAKTYLQKLDLSAGADLFAACHAVWPHYHEVLHNRKFAVRHLALKHWRPQIVIAGAGLDAMGLELLSDRPDTVIFEIDRDQMEVKKRLIGRTVDGARLHCLSADLAHPVQVVAALRAAGWRRNLPTLLVLEGISYYLTRQHVANLVKAVAPDRMIVDLLVPSRYLPAASRRIADGVFGAIGAACGLHTMSRYRPDMFARTTGRRVSETWTMQRIERARCGRVRRFKPPLAGWIELVVLR